MYRAMTQGIEVTVVPEFLAERSAPADSQYFWAYTVEIVNHSEFEVELKTRHWIITDGHGRVQEVRGDGVVGQQPRLAPGESFRYTSGCPLTTPEGTMEGSYGMLDELGRPFDVAIPLFALNSPLVKRTLH
jgi:ApaG protein